MPCVCVCVVCTIATQFSHCACLHLPFPLPPAQQVIVTCMRQTADNQERMVEQIRYGAPSHCMPTQCMWSHRALCFSRVPALHTIACFSFYFLVIQCLFLCLCVCVCMYVVRVSWSPCRLYWKMTVQACIDKERSTGGTRLRSTH